MRILILISSCLFASVVADDDPQASGEYWKNLATEHIREKFGSFVPEDKYPKNIIFFLGDGMGNSVISGARRYKNQRDKVPYLNKPLFMEKLEYVGLVKTSSYDKHVTDSAAGAVALFAGHKVHSTALLLNPKNVTFSVLPENGGKIKTPDCSIANHIDDGLAELAVNNEMEVGFVTTTRITHATPAALYAKGTNRYAETNDKFLRDNLMSCWGNDIAQQILSHPANKFKVMMGGGRANFHPVKEGGKRVDDRKIDEEWANLGGKRRVITTVKEFDNLKPGNSEKIVGLFSDSHFPYYLDEEESGNRTVPRLAEMTKKAIESLSASKNKTGYFLMVEGGHIDMAEHLNELGKSFEELIQFDEAVKTAFDMTDPLETLIIVTADHSHALSMPGYSDAGKGVLEQTDNVPGFFFATGPGEKTPRNFTKRDSEKIDFKSPAAIFTEQGYHGGEDVPLYANGPYSWLFSGSLENVEVAYRLKYLLCVDSDLSICKTFGDDDDREKITANDMLGVAALSMIVAGAAILLSLIFALIALLRCCCHRKSEKKNLNI